MFIYLLLHFILNCVKSFYINNSVLAQVDEQQSDKGPSPNHSQTTSYMDHHHVNTQPMAAIQQQLPQSGSLSPPPCKVDMT